MYTLGGLMVALPTTTCGPTLMEDYAESLADGEVSRGKLYKAGAGGYTRKLVPDILAAFSSTCWASRRLRGAGQLRAKGGEVLEDTAMDLETNATMVAQPAQRTPAQRQWPSRRRSRS